LAVVKTAQMRTGAYAQIG